MSRLRYCRLLLISCLGLQGAMSYDSKPFDDRTQTSYINNLLQIADTSVKACPDDVEDVNPSDD